MWLSVAQSLGPTCPEDGAPSRLCLSSICTHKHVSMRVHTCAHTLLLLCVAVSPLCRGLSPETVLLLSSHGRERRLLIVPREEVSEPDSDPAVFICPGHGGGGHWGAALPGSTAVGTRSVTEGTCAVGAQNSVSFSALSRLKALSHRCRRSGTASRGVADSPGGTVRLWLK